MRDEANVTYYGLAKPGYARFEGTPLWETIISLGRAQWFWRGLRSAGVCHSRSLVFIHSAINYITCDTQTHAKEFGVRLPIISVPPNKGGMSSFNIFELLYVMAEVVFDEGDHHGGERLGVAGSTPRS
jgi:hypothetical protein